MIRLRSRDEGPAATISYVRRMRNRNQIRRELAALVVRLGACMGTDHLAVRLQVDSSRAAALRHQRLDMFSVERLMHFATQLGHDVVITVRPHAPPGFRRSYRGAIRVVDESDHRAV